MSSSTRGHPDGYAPEQPLPQKKGWGRQAPTRRSIAPIGRTVYIIMTGTSPKAPKDWSPDAHPWIATELRLNNNTASEHVQLNLDPPPRRVMAFSEAGAALLTYLPNGRFYTLHPGKCPVFEGWWGMVPKFFFV